MKQLFRILIPAALVAVALGMLLAPPFTRAGVGTFQSTTINSPPFQVWDRIDTYHVVTTEGDTVAMTKTHFKTTANTKHLRAVPNLWTDADTAGHGVYCTAVGTNQWIIPSPSFAAYNIYFSADSTGFVDTLVTRLANWPVIGHTLADGMVTAGSIVAGAVGKAACDTSQVVVFTAHPTMSNKASIVARMGAMAETESLLCTTAAAGKLYITGAQTIHDAFGWRPLMLQVNAAGDSAYVSTAPIMQRGDVSIGSNVSSVKVYIPGLQDTSQVAPCWRDVSTSSNATGVYWELANPDTAQFTVATKSLTRVLSWIAIL